MTAAETAVATPDDAEEIFQESSGEPIEIKGHPCRVTRLRTREFFSLMKIFTASGMAGALLESAFDGEDTEEEIAQRMLAALVVAIPNAEPQFIEFVNRIVELPEGLEPEEIKAIRVELQNPETELTMTIIQRVIEQEAGELARLGKAARSWWSVRGPEIRRKAKAATDGAAAR